MSIIGIITAVSAITKLADTVQTIIKLLDKAFSDEKNKKEYFAEIEKLCEKELEKHPKTKTLTTEEENIIRKYVDENNIQPSPTLLCKLAVENNFTAIQMIVGGMKNKS